MGFKIARDPEHGSKVEGPPVKWRPRDLTIREKLEIVVRQGGYEPDGKTRLLPLSEGVQFDHHPALQRRRWDPAKEDTIPPACDLDYIEARNKKAHGQKTAKLDIPEIAKTRRLDGTTPPKKRKQKIMGRSSFQRRKP